METTISPTVEYIKSEMKRQEIGIQELADRINKPFSTISRMLKGEQEPRIGTVEQIFAALDLPPIGKNSIANQNQSVNIPDAGGPNAE